MLMQNETGHFVENRVLTVASKARPHLSTQREPEPSYRSRSCTGRKPPEKTQTALFPGSCPPMSAAAQGTGLNSKIACLRFLLGLRGYILTRVISHLFVFLDFLWRKLVSKTGHC